MEVREASVSVGTPVQTENLYNTPYLYLLLLEHLLANTLLGFVQTPSTFIIIMYFVGLCFLQYPTIYGNVISKPPTMPTFYILSFYG